MPHPIVFAHANGFPAGVYRQHFEAWRRAGHAVHAVERLGHDPARPPTDNWPHLVDELLACIDGVRARRVWLVGHSLGGMLCLLAAQQRPQRVAGVVLLDAPLLAGWRARALRLGKRSGLLARASPSRVARRRRETWPDKAALRAHFAAKRVFARWDPGVLEDYLRSAFVRRGGQWQLAFEREIEARIYDTLPDHIGRRLARAPLACPVAYIGGRDSREARLVGLEATQRLVGDRFVLLPGTHLFPMSAPAATAQAVLTMLAALDAA